MVGHGEARSDIEVILCEVVGEALYDEPSAGVMLEEAELEEPVPDVELSVLDDVVMSDIIRSIESEVADIDGNGLWMLDKTEEEELCVIIVDDCEEDDAELLLEMLVTEELVTLLDVDEKELLDEEEAARLDELDTVDGLGVLAVMDELDDELVLEELLRIVNDVGKLIDELGFVLELLVEDLLVLIVVSTELELDALVEDAMREVVDELELVDLREDVVVLCPP